LPGTPRLAAVLVGLVLMLRGPPRAPLLPYTTLFRSPGRPPGAAGATAGRGAGHPAAAAGRLHRPGPAPPGGPPVFGPGRYAPAAAHVAGTVRRGDQHTGVLHPPRGCATRPATVAAPRPSRWARPCTVAAGAQDVTPDAAPIPGDGRTDSAGVRRGPGRHRRRISPGRRRPRRSGDLRQWPPRRRPSRRGGSA